MKCMFKDKTTPDMEIYLLNDTQSCPKPCLNGFGLDYHTRCELCSTGSMKPLSLMKDCLIAIVVARMQLYCCLSYILSNYLFFSRYDFVGLLCIRLSSISIQRLNPSPRLLTRLYMQQSSTLRPQVRKGRMGKPSRAAHLLAKTTGYISDIIPDLPSRQQPVVLQNCKYYVSILFSENGHSWCNQFELKQFGQAADNS